MSSNNILADLQPQAVFKYFEQICAIPHGSGNVKQISDYLCEFAKERNLWFKQDESYNVIIKKPASNSESKAAPVILQGHIDMVAVKTNDKVKDMEKDLKNARPERVFITHSGCKQETVEKVRAYLEELGVFDEILETRAGGVISSHCGPGTLGVLYIAK